MQPSHPLLEALRIFYVTFGTFQRKKHWLLFPKLHFLYLEQKTEKNTNHLLYSAPIFWDTRTRAFVFL